MREWTRPESRICFVTRGFELINMNIAAEVCLSLRFKLIDLADLLILDYTVPAMEVELDEARLTFETNLFSVISMCQTFLPLLIKAKGTIVQIGSIAGVCLNYPPITIPISEYSKG